MLIASFPSGPWQANCYLLAREQGGECVVVDPGMGAADGVRQGLSQYGLHLAGVLLTHGHADHVAAAREIADEAEVPVWIHEADEDLLEHPMRAMSESAAPILTQLYGSTTFTAPREVRFLDDRASVAGISFEVRHAPGHTPGCALLLPDDELPLAFTGDVLFAGSVGRTDLPRGDGATMARSLSSVVLALPDELNLLPGHGPTTTMAAERATNPWLQAPALAALAQQAPRPGSDT